jgi:hypothetical protein
LREVQEWKQTREHKLDYFAPNDSGMTRRRKLRSITECGAIGASAQNHQLSL